MIHHTIYTQIFKGCNFADDPNPFKDHPLSSICIVIVLKFFQDLIFMDDKLPAKTENHIPQNLYIRIWYFLVYCDIKQYFCSNT